MIRTAFLRVSCYKILRNTAPKPHFYSRPKYTVLIIMHIESLFGTLFLKALRLLLEASRLEHLGLKLLR